MASPSHGLFITLEGGEGSGKSTQAQALKALLEARGFTVTLTREPAGCPLGHRLAELLKDPSSGLDPRSELFLFAAARAQHVAQVIRPALERGEVVICDRFADSTAAYQGYGRGLSLDDVRQVNRIATAGLVPDLAVLLDVPVDVGLARKELALSLRPRGPQPEGLSKGGETGPDRIGDEAADFHERVRQGYLALAAAEPDRFLVLDATRPLEETTEAIRQSLQQLLP